MGDKISLSIVLALIAVLGVAHVVARCMAPPVPHVEIVPVRPHPIMAVHE